jgi:hypothetical protein
MTLLYPLRHQHPDLYITTTTDYLLRLHPASCQYNVSPSSSVPPALNPPQERLYIVNSGLTRLDNGYQDTYEPGTLAERAYMRPMASIY